jgi:phosphopantetheinyl transferase (holo-ACP synthase)
MSQDGPSITSRAEAPPPWAAPIRGIGLGLESLSAYPTVENYLEDAFYRARFTPAEIAYCVGRESPATSFCTLAAVKRAVLKAEGVPTTPEQLAATEITCDEAGNPSRRDCLVSVDQSETNIIAVCLWTREPIAPVPIIQGRTLGSYPPLQRLGIRVIMGLAALSLLFTFGAGVWFILNQLFH